MVAITPRSAWGARPPRKRTTVATTSRRAFMLHYVGGTPMTQAHSACPGVVRAFQRQHLAQGWHDIGYNFLVCQHGTIYEGRGWGVTGSHCPRSNTSAIGAQFIIGGSQAPSNAAKGSMRALYDEANRRARRTLRRMAHSDGIATECPGKPATAWLRAGMPRPAGGAPPATTFVPLALDGRYGLSTARARQTWLGTQVDGIVSGQSAGVFTNSPGLAARDNWRLDKAGRGSEMIRADQRRLAEAGLYRGAVDGLAGPGFWRAMQAEFKTTQDGRVSDPSEVVRAVQRSLNWHLSRGKRA